MKGAVFIGVQIASEPMNNDANIEKCCEYLRRAVKLHLPGTSTKKIQGLAKELGVYVVWPA